MSDSEAEIVEGAKDIYATDAIRHVVSQSDAIYRSADLPKMFSSRAGVCIAGLIVVFATFAVCCIRPPESDQSRDVNLRAENLVRAHDGMAGDGLKPKIANGFRTQEGCERPRNSVVAREAAASSTCVYYTSSVERID